MHIQYFIFITLVFSIVSCQSSDNNYDDNPDESSRYIANIPFLPPNTTPAPKNYKSIHVFVALCDNKYQGIVPVPAKIGNGQDPDNNLYWGTAYGIKTFFKRSKMWKLKSSIKNPAHPILERLLYEHKDSSIYLLADAYDGEYIKQANIDMLKALSGRLPLTVNIENENLQFGGNSDLLTYIGHNGLMDFSLDLALSPVNKVRREAIVLSCISEDYYSPFIEKAGAYPLLLTTGFMAPEAYTLEWALDGWCRNESSKNIKERAAKAYNHYQKCGINGARGLFVAGE